MTKEIFSGSITIKVWDRSGPHSLPLICSRTHYRLGYGAGGNSECYSVRAPCILAVFLTNNWALAALPICTGSFLPTLVSYATGLMVVLVGSLVYVYYYHYLLIFMQHY